MVHKAKTDQAQAEQFVRFVGERVRVLRSERGMTQEKSKSRGSWLDLILTTLDKLSGGRKAFPSIH